MNSLQSETRERLRGPINSVPVAFSEDGQIDYAALSRMIERSLDAGCGVVMLTWGNSLMSLLTDGGGGRRARRGGASGSRSGAHGGLRQHVGPAEVHRVWAAPP